MAIAATRDVEPDGTTDASRAPAEDDSSRHDAAIRQAIDEVRAGDPNAYGRVVELCQGRLTSFATSLLKDPYAAQELCQDAFVRAYRNLARYDERRPFYPWLATIAFRLAQDRWRRQRHDRELARSYGATVEEGGVDPMSVAITDQQSRRLWNAVNDLPGGERAALMLFYRQELSVRETARVLGVTEGTVKTFLFRGRRKLRDALGSTSDTAGSET